MNSKVDNNIQSTGSYPIFSDNINSTNSDSYTDSKIKLIDLLREANKIIISVRRKVQEKGFDSVDEFLIANNNHIQSRLGGNYYGKEKN